MILLSCGIKCKSTELYRARVMTRATRATQATPRPRARPARATAASPASWAGAGAGRTAARAPRTPRTPATPAPAPRTPASASGPWRRTRGGRSWTGAEWMPRMSSMSSWRTFRQRTWLCKKVKCQYSNSLNSNINLQILGACSCTWALTAVFGLTSPAPWTPTSSQSSSMTDSQAQVMWSRVIRHTSTSFPHNKQSLVIPLIVTSACICDVVNSTKDEKFTES